MDVIGVIGRVFICDRCGQRFVRSKELRIHAGLCTDKPSSDEDAPSSSSSSSSLDFDSWESSSKPYDTADDLTHGAFLESSTLESSSKPCDTADDLTHGAFFESSTLESSSKPCDTADDLTHGAFFESSTLESSSKPCDTADDLTHGAFFESSTLESSSKPCDTADDLTHGAFFESSTLESSSKPDDTEENVNPHPFLESLKLVHGRYIDSVGSLDKSLPARRLGECEELAIHFSRLLCVEKTDVIRKTLIDGISYAFHDAPTRLSFLTCGLIHFVVNLPKSYYPEIVAAIEQRLKIVNTGADTCDSYCSSFIQTLKEDTDSLDLKDVCIRSKVGEEAYNEYLKSLAESRRKAITQRSMGREGERLAYKFFSSTFSKMKVSWVNEGDEMGKPYDLQLKTQGDRSLYIDVKATTVKNKEWFLISKNEYFCAVEECKCYGIAHIGFFEDDLIRLTTYMDPMKLTKSRQMRIALHPKSCCSKPVKKIIKARVEKEKDPGAHKRPPSAFCIFMDQFRKEYMEKFPDIQSDSVVYKKQGALKWNSMDESDKAPYVEKADTLKAEYKTAQKRHKAEVKEKSASTSDSVPTV